MINFIKYVRYLTGIKEDLSGKHLSEDYLTPPTTQEIYQIYKEIEPVINKIQSILKERAFYIAKKVAKATDQVCYNTLEEVEILGAGVTVFTEDICLGERYCCPITFEKHLLGMTEEELEAYCKHLEYKTTERQRIAQEKAATYTRQKKEELFNQLKKELGK